MWEHRLMKVNRVLIAHNAVPEEADPSTADVLDQVALVREALSALDLCCETVPVPEVHVWDAVRVKEGDVVFNLIESPPGRPQYQLAAAGALELLGVAYTGSRIAALFLTTDKLVTRAVLTAEGIPVAPGCRFDVASPRALEVVPPPWILKPALEDASVGLEGKAVVDTADAAIARGRELSRRFPDEPIVIEHYLPGREFNISVLEVEGRAHVLPVAEMTFVGFPPDARRVVGYEAKWVEGHYAYEGTVRAFPDEQAESGLLAALRETARRAWEATGVAGYARVDVRLDEEGAPRVLEVNANPCLSAGAGFIAGCERGGLSRATVIQRILASAVRHHRA